MAVVNYERVLDGAGGLSGKFGESLRASEKWQIRVDSPLTSKLDILQSIASQAGVTWGSAHPELAALKAMEFDLSPERDGMVWILTVQYYVPPVNKQPKENSIPEDFWERSGGTTSVPAFEDYDGGMITNAAGDPLEGLSRERDETTWKLTKHYETNSELDSDIEQYSGAVNSTEWAGYPAKTWKAYFTGASKQSISKLDGTEDGGLLEFIKASWEFRLEVQTWKLMPWDVGFMELVSGERKAILGDDGKPVKQPVALNSNGTRKTAGMAPSVIRGGNGADVYPLADWSSAFGTPTILDEE